MKTIAERLKDRMDAKGYTQYRLWKLSGVSQPTIGRILDGESKEPERGTVEKLAKILGCTTQWLYEGKGSIDGAPEAAAHYGITVHPSSVVREPPPGSSVGVHDDAADLDPDSYVWIDRFDLRLSAGSGNAAWVIKEKDPISFRRSWFDRKRLNPEACKALYVRGRSMEPVLNDWDTVMIDTNDTEIIDGEIYAVSFRGSLYIKTLERTAIGLRLKSENPSFESIEVANGDSDHLTVLGKKVWRAG